MIDSQLLVHVDIARLLKEERTKKGMSLQAVADVLNCSASYIFRIEKNHRKAPSVAITTGILELFNHVDVNDYLRDDYLSTISIEEKMINDILKQIKVMDTNNFNEVNDLLQKINHLQATMKKN